MIAQGLFLMLGVFLATYQISDKTDVFCIGSTTSSLNRNNPDCVYAKECGVHGCSFVNRCRNIPCTSLRIHDYLKCVQNKGCIAIPSWTITAAKLTLKCFFTASVIFLLYNFFFL